MRPFVRMSTVRMGVMPSTLPRPSSRALATALATSLLLHALLLGALSRIVGAPPETESPVEDLRVRLTAVATPVPEVRPLPTPPSPQSQRPQTPAAQPPIPLPVAPRLAPRAPKEIVLGRVSINVDTDGPVESEFEALVASEHAGTMRVPLEFAEQPVVDFPLQSLRDIPQRRIRTLVRVRETGDVEFLRTDEYDAALVLAIRDALERTRAKPANEATKIAPGWAIVVFWFELSAPLPAR
jgi:hypothetical protein